jgi:hypothetical protein
MTTSAALPKTDPRQRMVHIRGLLAELAEHCREDIKKIEEPRAQALLETTAEVLEGLMTAYDHYEAGTEEGMRHGPM